VTVRAGVVRVCVRFLSETRPDDSNKPWGVRTDQLMGLMISKQMINRNGRVLPWYRWYRTQRPTPEEAWLAAKTYREIVWWRYRNPHAKRGVSPSVARRGLGLMEDDPPGARSHPGNPGLGHDVPPAGRTEQATQGATGAGRDTQTADPVG
jgi:hypothetical protein